MKFYNYLKYIILFSVIFFLIGLLFQFITRPFNLFSPQNFTSFATGIWLSFSSLFWPTALFFALRFIVKKTNETIFWKILLSAFLIEFLNYSFNYFYEYTYYEWFIKSTLPENVGTRQNLMNILSGNSKTQFNFFYNPLKLMYYQLKGGNYFSTFTEIFNPFFYLGNPILKSLFVGSLAYGIYRTNFSNSKIQL